MAEGPKSSDPLQRAWPKAEPPSVGRQRKAARRPDWYECVFRVACKGSFWVFLLIVIVGTLMLLLGALDDPAKQSGRAMRLPPVHEPRLTFGADDVFSILAYGGAIVVFVLWLGRALKKIERETGGPPESNQGKSSGA